MLPLLFRVDASHSIGMGHLSRCLVLAHEAKLYGIEVKFVLYGDSEAMDVVLAEGFICILKSPATLSQQILEVCDLVESDDVVILDFVHSLTLSQCVDIPELLKEWRNNAKAIALLDGVNRQGLATICDKLDIDLLLVPYAGSEGNSAGCVEHTCAGAKFAILPPIYQNQKNRQCRLQADRVMVTCGGSDAKGVTGKILKALDLVESNLEIQIIVGPMFHPAQIENLEMLKQESHHKVTLIFSPPSLVSYMIWCDIAVATNGLTKYELAATGTPAVLLSIDDAHEEANLGFSKQKTTLCLGIVYNVTREKISKSVNDLLLDYPQRKVMAINGQKLIDGKGVSRVVENIMSLKSQTIMSI
jgi:UDP-2,4-diacetamido-2,4,6-trideoxy-beta-L-altropyranose hydrolase